jgi:hypothetical protein
MSITPKKRIDTTRPLVVREYDIGGKKYIVTSTSKAGAREDAAAIVRRLIRKEIREKTAK